MRSVVCTYVDRESVFLHLWLRYYSQQPYDNLIIFYNETTAQASGFDIEDFLLQQFYVTPRIKVVKVKNDTKQYVIPASTFMQWQSALLQQFEVVVWTDVDEIIFHPDIGNFLKNITAPYLVTKGFEVIQHSSESPYKSKEWLYKQRGYGMFSKWYNKNTIITATTQWTDGKHAGMEPSDPNLWLIHLGRFDYNTLLQANKFNTQYYPVNLKKHNSLDSDEDLKTAFKKIEPSLQPIPNTLLLKLNI